MSVPMKPTEAWAAVSCGGVTDGRVLGVLLNDEPLRTLWEPGLRQGDVRLARVLITEGWRPIAEAPKDDKVKLLLWLEDKGSVIGYWRKDIGIWWQPYAMTIRPTHFMPLTAPPVDRAAMRGEG